MLMALGLCDEHLREVEENGPLQLLTKKALDGFAAEVQRTAGREVDVEGCTATRVLFTEDLCQDMLAAIDRSRRSQT